LDLRTQTLEYSMELLNIATGVILVMLGMRYVRKGLDRLFGEHLPEWLQQMTGNRYKAFFAGMCAGVVAPSSSAIAMLSVQMLNQTALTAGRMLAVVLGANVGITVSVQLVAFRLQSYSGLFIVIGGIGFLFAHRAFFRGVGQMLLGVGMIFLAMQMIGDAGLAGAKNPDLKMLFSVVDSYPVLIFVITALLTVVFQSSTASIGLGIGLAQSGLLPDGITVPWVLGANLGICLTMLIAGWGSVEGRRLAMGSLLIKGGVALLLLLGGIHFFHELLRYLPGTIDRKVANLNTGLNLVLGLLALPILNPISRLLNFIVESQPIDNSDEPDSYLDPLLLQTPALALNQAAREELRMMDEIKLMLRTVWTMLWGKNGRLTSKIEIHQSRMSQIEYDLKQYLSKVSDENLSENAVAWKLALLDYSEELSVIGVLIRRDLCDSVGRQLQSSGEPSPEERDELELLYTRTLARTEKATVLLMSRETKLAEEMIKEKEQINMQLRASRKARLELPVSVQYASANLSEMLTCLGRINSRLTSLAYDIAREESMPESLVENGQ
jgi:phosphate:Na+ symporter